MPTIPAAAVARPLGLVLGVLADAVLADPARWHPVAGFGRMASAVERRLYADDVMHGAVFAAASVAVPVVAGQVVERATRKRPVLATLATAAATWAALGGTSLAREGLAMARCLEEGQLPQARYRLRNLCARDAAGLDTDGLARATVESLAENTSDAVVAPLLWGALAGVPGLLGYRAVNTLDAMVGYRNARYLRFGRVSARADDLANVVPARVTAAATMAVSPLFGRSPRATFGVVRRDGRRHPSPNAGYPEAAAAGALGVRLGGSNAYHGMTETRPELGDGRAPQVGDIRSAVRLTRLVGLAGAVVGVALAGAVTRRRE